MSTENLLDDCLPQEHEEFRMTTGHFLFQQKSIKEMFL
jgi:hypothetical protein